MIMTQQRQPLDSLAAAAAAANLLGGPGALATRCSRWAHKSPKGPKGEQMIWADYADLARACSGLASALCQQRKLSRRPGGDIGAAKQRLKMIN